MRPVRTRFPTLLSACLFAVVGVNANAAEGVGDHPDWPRFGPQVLIGTSGFEPGYMGEFDFGTFRLRPEVFLQDWGRPGIGVSGLWRLPVVLKEGHDLHIGARLAFHNGEHTNDPRGELSAIGIYNLPLPLGAPSRHNLELIGALGVIDKDGVEPAVSAGAGYVYRF